MYGWFAERYQWTPDQVDALPAWCADRYPFFAKAWDDASGNDDQGGVELL